MSAPESLNWTTEKRKLSQLKFYENNPRQNEHNQFERLKQSIQDYNYVELVAIDADNTILAGHMRVRALIALHGKKLEIEVRVPSRPLTQTERDKYVIISNKIVGDWDFDILANHFDTNMLFDLGFDPQDFDLELTTEEKPKKVKLCPHCGKEL